MIFLPFTSSFALLVIARLVQIMALGAFCTADASLIVYLLGPEKSRPFTMAFHALIGAGFLAATFLVRPFLPESGDQDIDEICGRSNITEVQEDVKIESSVADDVLIPTIAWPFIISGAWCVVFSVGFLILARLPYKMPRYYDNDDSAKGKDLPDKDIKYWKLFLAVVFFYYFISCGIERIYQPMAFTFGICGPLALAPRDAVVIDSCYNGGFMCGRLVSALIAFCSSKEYDLDVPGHLYWSCHILVLPGRIQRHISVCWDSCAGILHFLAIWILLLLGG